VKISEAYICTRQIKFFSIIQALQPLGETFSHPIKYYWNKVVENYRRQKQIPIMGEKRIAYRLLVGKPEGKRPLGRPRHWRVDNIKMDLLDIGWGGVAWIGLAQIGTSGELL
jgi:hypothetical protein